MLFGHLNVIDTKLKTFNESKIHHIAFQKITYWS